MIQLSEIQICGKVGYCLQVVTASFSQWIPNTPVLVWHASSKPYQDYPKLGSRFISEFGISSLPHIKTTESYLIGFSPFRTSSALSDYGFSQQRNFAWAQTSNLPSRELSVQLWPWRVHLHLSASSQCAPSDENGKVLVVNTVAEVWSGRLVTFGN